jgi:hypothetical protein
MHRIFNTLLLSAIVSLMPVIGSGQSNGLNFDGINDYIQTTYPGISGSSARTVEAWIRTTANCDPNNGGSQKVILDWGAGSPNGSRYTLNILWSNSIRLEVAGNGLSATIPINNGAWHHVAAVYDPGNSLGSTLLYINGALAAQGNLTVAVNTATTVALRIGCRVDGLNYFLGDIDEVRIWNTARSASQILASYNKEICSNPSNLVCYYTFNQGQPSGNNSGQNILFNQVGSQNGTLQGFALTGSGSNWVSGPQLPGASYSTDVIQACANYLSPTGKLYTSTGIYKDTLVNVDGCDSIITTNLTLLNSGVNLNLFACDQYLSPTGKIYTTSGTYTDTLTNAANCDSIITQFLTINHTTFNTISPVACKQYLSPTGKFYSTSGTYIDTLVNANYCDSILTQNLTVNTVNTGVIQNGNTFTAQATGATFRWLNCNNNFLAVPGATNAAFTPSVNGAYAVEVTQNNCKDTSQCFVLNVGIIEAGAGSLAEIFPNPSDGHFTLKFPVPGNYIYLSVRDIGGRILISREIENTEIIRIESDLNAGIYILEGFIDGERFVRRLVIK